MSYNKILRTTLLLPQSFIKSWLNSDEDGNDYFNFYDFHSAKTYDVQLLNKPFIEYIFENDDSFDLEKIKKQFYAISKLARTILDMRIKKADTIKLTGKENLFLKYFYFLITILNGDYKIQFSNNNHKFTINDLLSDDVSSESQHDIRLIINYVLFEMYDSLFTSRTFSDLYKYIKDRRINIFLQEYQKVINVPRADFDNQNFKFIDIYFHNVVNNTFLKFFQIDNKARNRFLLTNKIIANFIDEKTKFNLLSSMIIHPKHAIGLVNMGPGRGEYRPLFKYFKDNKINVELMPKSLIPEHEIKAENIYLDDEQSIFFKSYSLNEKQVNLINELISIKGLKYPLDNFDASKTDPTINVNVDPETVKNLSKMDDHYSSTISIENIDAPLESIEKTIQNQKKETSIPDGNGKSALQLEIEAFINEVKK